MVRVCCIWIHSINKLNCYIIYTILSKTENESWCFIILLKIYNTAGAGMLIICQRNILDTIEMQMRITTRLNSICYCFAARQASNAQRQHWFYFYYFYRGIDSKDKFIVRQVAATQPRDIGSIALVSPRPHAPCHPPSSSIRICLHFIASDID